MKISNMVDNTSIKHPALLQSLCKPLKPLGIDYFCYQFVSHQGDWFTLGNNPDWLHYCAEQETHKQDPSLLPPEKIAPGCFLPLTYAKQSFQDALIKPAIEKFDISQCLAITRSTPRGSLCYFFAGSQQNPHLIATYLNQINRLQRQFIPYVDQQISSVFEGCLEQSINLAELNNPIFLNNEDAFFKNAPLPMNLPIEPLKPRVRSGINYHFREKQVKFTPREAECLNLLIDGYISYKAIARQLNLSARTIEDYLNNIRLKTGCAKNIDLMKLIFLHITP